MIFHLSQQQQDDELDVSYDCSIYITQTQLNKFISNSSMLTLSKQTRQYTYQIPQCHNKLNQYGKLALQAKPQPFRSLYTSKLNNSHAQTNKSYKGGEETLSMMLLSKRHRSQMKEMNPELQQKIMKLEILGLTTPRELKQVKYEGSIKIPTVHNDYHTRATNHGYSRSQTGGIFPK